MIYMFIQFNRACGDNRSVNVRRESDIFPSLQEWKSEVVCQSTYGHYETSLFVSDTILKYTKTNSKKGNSRKERNWRTNFIVWNRRTILMTARIRARYWNFGKLWPKFRSVGCWYANRLTVTGKCSRIKVNNLLSDNTEHFPFTSQLDKRW